MSYESVISAKKLLREQSEYSRARFYVVKPHNGDKPYIYESLIKRKNNSKYQTVIGPFFTPQEARKHL